MKTSTTQGRETLVIRPTGRDGTPPDERDHATTLALIDRGLRLARRRWALMLAVWIGVMGATALALWTMPRQFESSALFLVKNARQELLVGPNDRATAVYRDSVPEEVLNSELELLRSRDILAQVVGELGLDEAYRGRGHDPATASELAIRALGHDVAAGAIRRTNMIRVSYGSHDAERAAAVVRHLADAYLAAHLAIRSSPGIYELFKAQAEKASAELRHAEEERAGLARTANLVLPELQTREALESIQLLDAEYRALNAQMREQASRLRVAERQMIHVPRRIRTAVRSVPHSVEHLHILLVELQNERTKLLTKFNPDDRLVAEVDRQLGDTKAALERVTQAKANEESSDVNPTWLALEQESLNAQLALAGLASRATEVREQLAGHRTAVLEFTEATPRYEALARRVEDARSRYELYVAKEEEARIAEALDAQQVSNVVLAQAPVVAHLASTPDVRLGLMVGLLAATLLAIGAAVLADPAASVLSRLAALRVQRAPSVVARAHP